MTWQTSLNRWCSWGTVLPLLGTELRAAALPARVRCPLCAENLLQVYKDLVLGGQWYWCPKCRFAGDSIDLAARAWRIGPASAVLKLAAAGVRFPPETGDREIAAHVAAFVDRRKQVDDLWREASQAPASPDGPLGAFAARLGIPAVRPRDWQARGGQFVGVLERDRVIMTFQPAQDVDMPGGHQQGSGRIFKGRGWGPLLVIPHHDLPGRLRGLLLIGREARFPEDFLYRRASPHGGPEECGLSMLPAILGPGADLGGAIFACTDPAEALRLQLGHLAEHGQPLPLVGAWGDRPSLAWGMLPPRPLVVFGPEAAPVDAARLLRLARQADAAAGRAARTPGQRPVEVLRAVARGAVSWQARLEEHLAAGPAAEAEEVFLQMGLERGDAERFLRDSGDKARANLRGLTDIEETVRMVEYGRRSIAEDGGVWKDGRSGELLSDVVIRVDRVIHQRRRGRIVHEGRLQRRGAEAPFVVDQATLDKNPAAWLRNACLAAGLGLPSVASQWARRLVAIAQLFGPPAFVESEGILGWDEARNAFVFPKFAIARGGSVVPSDAAVSEDQPGLRFEPPDGLTPAQVHALSAEDEGTRLFWAAAAAILASAVAPCLGLDPGSVVFTSRGAVHTMVPAAAALGCPVAELGRPVASAVNKVVAARKVCIWPVAATYADRRIGAAVADLPPGVVVREDTWAGAVLSLLGGWTVVDAAAAAAASLLPIMTHGPAVVPNYIRHFCAAGLHVGGGNLVDALLDDLAAWFEEHGGNPHAVRRAAAIVLPDDAAAFPDRFADLVARLHYEGDLASTRSDMGEPVPRQPTLAVLEGGLLHIPRAGVVRPLMRRDTPHLDVTLVTRRLAAAGVLVDERDHGGHPGWVVPEQWWSDRQRRWRSKNQTQFRKVQ